MIKRLVYRHPEIFSGSNGVEMGHLARMFKISITPDAETNSPWRIEKELVDDRSGLPS